MSAAAKKLCVPQHCLAFDYINQINEISKPLFERYPLDYFDYARVFYDGSWIFFTSYAGISQYFFDSGFTFLPHVQFKKAQCFHLLSSINHFSKYIADVKENFKIDHLLSYAEKYENYIDLYWFGANRERSGVIDFYLNNMDLLKNYALYFQDHAKDLIKKAEQEKIIIPKGLTEDYNGAFQRIKTIQDQNDFLQDFLTKRSPMFNVQGQPVTITRREMDCLRFLVQGFTAKMIARQLSLSQRTVESYFEKIKIKLNCNSRAQLVELVFTALNAHNMNIS